ncbi:MAG: ABC transporter ATP-binding protein [Egibacteraceae bacterium]
MDEGELVGLLGRNGMGKTTLVHTIAGFLTPTRGTIRIDGRDVTHRPAERISDEGVTLVPQGHRVFPTLTVGENLTVALRTRGDEPWSIDDLCDRFPVLAQRWEQRAGSLSGGQQQVLAIARALVGNGRPVVMDEPAEGLDPARVEVLAAPGP